MIQRQDVTEYGLRRLLIVVGVMAAALMQSLDTTIANVALPTIQGNLGATADEATWVVTAHTIAAIVVIPLTPWLQDRFGRKAYFCASIVGFTLASVACVLSGSLPVLVVSRVVQGAFGGGLLATGQSILRDTFPPDQLAISQGVFAIGVILGPALGPTLGGLLVDNYSWNLCFDINVLPGAIGTLMLLLMLRDPTTPRRTPVDIPGLVLLAAMLSTMQYVLTEGERNYWFADGTIDLMSLLCVSSMGAFVWWELWKAKDPIVDLRIFRNRSVSSGSILALALGGVMLGSTYLPQLTQGPLGYTPTLSGELFLLRAIPIAIATPFVTRVATSVDARWLLGGAFVVTALGMWAQARVTTVETDFWQFGLPLMLLGIGSALLFVPLSVAVLGATSPSEGPKAGAMINLAIQLGGSVFIALLDVLIDRRQTFHSEILVSVQSLSTRRPPSISRTAAHSHSSRSWSTLKPLFCRMPTSTTP
jgi:DHA2 family multidrug resistance protein